MFWIEVTLLVSSLKPGLKGGRVSIRTLRSATSSSFESVKLSAKREPLTLQEVVRHPQDTELAVTKGDYYYNTKHYNNPLNVS